MSDSVVRVDWYDAEQDARWLTRAEASAKKPPLARSYGVIVHRDKRVLVLAHSLVGDDVGVNIIPAGMVKKVTRLR